MALRTLSLFAGVGGLDIALDIATGGRSRTVGYVERDSYAAATLVARMADETLDRAPVWSDVTTFDGRPWLDAVDCVVAGFNCQPFSAAGRKLGLEDERWLWSDISRIVRECGATLLFFENVPPITKHGLPTILRDLAEMGFDAEWGCFKASDVGAPHKRERWFLVAVHCRVRLEGLQPAWTTEAATWRCGPEVDLADADGPGRGAVGRSRAPGESHPDGCHLKAAELEDATSDGVGVPGVGDDGRDADTAIADAQVADAAGRGVRLGEAPGPIGQPARAGEAPLVDAASIGLQSGCGHGSSASSEQRWSRLDDPGLPYWPFGPDDRDAWAGVPMVAQPALRRMADGVADLLDERSSRLRCVGNGVVPLQAAVAFTVLLARLEDVIIGGGSDG